MFATRIACPPWVDHHPGYLMRGMGYFPLVGGIVGLWCAIWHDAVAVIWPGTPAVVVSTAASVWLTGCLHEDGLADSVDGFGGGWTKTQIFRIMKDSRVGTYGAVGVGLYLLAKVHPNSESRTPNPERRLPTRDPSRLSPPGITDPYQLPFSYSLSFSVDLHSLCIHSRLAAVMHAGVAALQHDRVHMGPGPLLWSGTGSLGLPRTGSSRGCSYAVHL